MKRMGRKRKEKNGEKRKRKSADISNMPFAKLEWLGEGGGGGYSDKPSE